MTVAAADGASATACSEPLNLAAAGRATEIVSIVTERSNGSGGGRRSSPFILLIAVSSANSGSWNVPRWKIF